jgi:hypothetical protein
MANVAATIGQINKMLWRPFRQRVDMETAVLLLALLLVLCGGWHLVLERVEL